MVNTWSLLFDELKMNENFEDRYEDSIKSKYWYDYDRNDPDRDDPFVDDGVSMTGNPAPESQDTIVFSSDIHAAESVPMGSIFGPIGEDTLSFDLNINNKDPNRFKYNEDAILKELTDYISSTYRQHYSSGDEKIQTLDLIEACGDGEAFCRSNILKYASRYDKKGTSRRDILKIMHYAVLLMHFNDKNAKRETYPQ
jgi:hypothetical protein